VSQAICIDDQLAIGPQPSEADLKQLAQEGYKTVINLRVSNEDEQMPAPEEEGDRVRGLSMEYLHLPVTLKQVRPEQVDNFRHAVEQLPKPIYVHCASGKRAGAFATMAVASRQGWSANDALEHARRKGCPLDKPELAELVQSYVERQ
jgi:uncharacterized protein (TIGR01244 family)